jgi:hypothetical protein
VIFQVLDVAADGGLRQMNGLARSGKTFQFNDLAKNIKLP